MSVLDRDKYKVALVGNPNVGKSVIFGLLTGKYVTVSNYPGTTVEVSRGICSGLGGGIEVVDTPGANSLIPLSEDESVTRDMLLEEYKKHVVQVVDAKAAPRRCRRRGASAPRRDRARHRRRCRPPRTRARSSEARAG